MPSFLGLDYVLPVIPLSIEPNTLTQRALSGLPFFARSDAQYWRLTFSLQPLPKKDARVATLFGHLADHNIHTPFTVDMPQHLGVTYDSKSVITAMGDHSAGASIINVRGTIAVAVPAERFIKFANHPKVYRIRQAVPIELAKTAQFRIYPALAKEVTNATQIVMSDVPLKCVYASSQVFGTSYLHGGLVQYTFAVEEYPE